MSSLVFAGSSQLIAVDIWRDPAPWALLALTTNARPPRTPSRVASAGASKGTEYTPASLAPALPIAAQAAPAVLAASVPMAVFALASFSLTSSPTTVPSW